VATRGLPGLRKSVDIIFEDSLISREAILQEYANFLLSPVIHRKRSSSVVLHTGSVCFDVVTLVAATVACVLMDDTDPYEMIQELNVGDLVLYKSQRHRWLGLEIRDGVQYFVLEQDGRGRSGSITSWLPLEENKALIKPYHGSSEVTDGRGIRRKKSNRLDFISWITEKEPGDIPGITGVSVVIVAERTTFDRIQKGVCIEYGKGRTIGLLDIVPASYYTSRDEAYQFGSNPSKAEPVLKIASKVSVARDIVLDQHGGKVLGFIVMGDDAASKGSYELPDLLNRRSLRFTHLSMHIDSMEAEKYVFDESTTVFACTRELLLQHISPKKVENQLTAALNRQVSNIVNNEVRGNIVRGGLSWEIYREVMKALYTIRHSGWDEEHKRKFLVLAHSLLNLMNTAVFPMTTMEHAISKNQLHIGVISPKARIEQLWELAERSDSLESQCLLVVSVLDDLYESFLVDCPKYRALKDLINSTPIGETAIIVPKAYYADILLKESIFSTKRVLITTANRFDGTRSYDRVIGVGNFFGDRFDPQRCTAAARIVVLLYENEGKVFARQRVMEERYKRRLNFATGLGTEFVDDQARSDDENSIDLNIRESLDIEAYLDTISTFDLRNFASGLSGMNGSTPTSEVSAFGRFVSGEQIMFSKYYKAVVYVPGEVKNSIVEKDVEKLSAGDVLVFTKRDDFTINIVDTIYDALQTGGKFDRTVLEATEKAQWWKEVLRDFQTTNDLSYRQLAKELGRHGSCLTDVSIRQWLVAESHIVGPRDEETLRQIATMTQDSYLLSDVRGYFEACRVVRSQRRRILRLIGEAIEDKLRGHKPPPGSELEIVYDNVENLSETLELQSISFSDEPILVPTNLVNRPMCDMEVVS